MPETNKFTSKTRVSKPSNVSTITINVRIMGSVSANTVEIRG
jgi:hypothetical protein